MEPVTEIESLESIKAQSDALSQFGQQIRFALDHSVSHGLHVGSFKNIIIAGLGGSGIGGHLIKAYYKSRLPIPIEVVSDYQLPFFAGTDTLLIACSYSGNTEETISVYEEAISKNIRTLVVSSGGKLTEMALKQGHLVYQIPSGFQPRMALGYSLTYLFLILSELHQENLKDTFLEIAEEVEKTEEYEDYGYGLYDSFSKYSQHKIVVISDDFYYPVAVRFCQQVQENAKAEAFCHQIPEANHNVIESYYGQIPSVFILLHGDQHERISGRFDFLNSLLEVENNKVLHLVSAEDNIASMYKIIFRLDWLSLAMAKNRRVNALTVPNIASLKEFLEQL